jgi:hypothetical protein
MQVFQESEPTAILDHINRLYDGAIESHLVDSDAKKILQDTALAACS